MSAKRPLRSPAGPVLRPPAAAGRGHRRRPAGGLPAADAWVRRSHPVVSQPWPTGCCKGRKSKQWPGGDPRTNGHVKPWSVRPQHSVPPVSRCTPWRPRPRLSPSTNHQSPRVPRLLSQRTRELMASECGQWPSGAEPLHSSHQNAQGQPLGRSAGEEPLPAALWRLPEASGTGLVCSCGCRPPALPGWWRSLQAGLVAKAKPLYLPAASCP